MHLAISKCYFSHNFHWSPSKLYENIGYIGCRRKSECLLEYCNEKLASIFYLKLFKTFLCTGSSVQAERQGPCVSCFLDYEHVCYRRTDMSRRRTPDGCAVVLAD